MRGELTMVKINKGLFQGRVEFVRLATSVWTISPKGKGGGGTSVHVVEGVIGKGGTLRAPVFGIVCKKVQQSGLILMVWIVCNRIYHI